MKEQNYLVLYIDILGYQQMLMDKDISNGTIVNALKEMERYTYGSGELSFEEKVKIYMFSDNIAVCVKATSKETRTTGLFLLSLMAARLQMFCAIEYGIFIRGSIVQGKLYAESRILFGDAIVKAVEMEKEAKFPRIIIESKLFADAIDGYKAICKDIFFPVHDDVTYKNLFLLLKRLININNSEKVEKTGANHWCELVSQDTDEQYYIDFLNQLFFWYGDNRCNAIDVAKYINRYAVVLYIRLRKFINNDVILPKYVWCVEKLMQFIPKLIDEIQFGKNAMEEFMNAEFLLTTWSHEGIAKIIEQHPD